MSVIQEAAAGTRILLDDERMNLASGEQSRRVRNFDQLFGCTLFDDGNCEEPNGCDSDADLRAVRTVRLTEKMAT